MQREHRDAIQRNFSSLVEQTDLDLMVAALYEKGVFSEPMIEPYKDTSKDQRTRKRQLYREITRRGPHAFGHLLDALSENGYWDLVRDLDPSSSLHSTNARPIQSQTGESSFLSISEKKKIGTQHNDSNRNQASGSSSLNIRPDNVNPMDTHEQNGNIMASSPDKADQNSSIPTFNVVKCEKFVEANGSDIQLYRTRGPKRGVLVMFSYATFSYGMEEQRRGAANDVVNLRYLFSELGFKVLVYENLNLRETHETLRELRHGELSAGVESVFIVFASHGYARAGTGDLDIRCHDSGLISFLDIIDYFNNDKFPELRGVPKVFIFQTCRGPNDNSALFPPGQRHLHAPEPADAEDARVRHDGAGDASASSATSDAPASARVQTDGHKFQDESAGVGAGAGGYSKDRMYSDILIAHSTVPGHVSNRDPARGSWFIQALCSVFAARAHDCHVEKLFTLVDKRMQKLFHTQTSSVDRWGFNRRLYLHPGICERR